MNIKGYTLLPSDFSKADTRGVCVYLKNHLTASQIVPKSSAIFNDAVWISINESGSSEKFLFGCVYRSGTPNTAKKYDKALYEHLLWASQEIGYCKKGIVGDFNMPNVEWNPGPGLIHRSGRRGNSDAAYLNSDELFVECIRDTFFHQHVTEDTRYRNGNFS